MIHSEMTECVIGQPWLSTLTNAVVSV